VDADAAAPPIADALDAAQSAYDDLLGLAEEVADEWSYVNDLADAWRARFDDVAARRGADRATPELAAAVDALAAEIAALDDPHRAIDWLSTFPQLVLIAVGERP
jgi:hypothetical protein